MRPPVRAFAQNSFFQIITYAAFTAFLIVVGNKLMGNGTLTITWASGAPIVCTISANKLKTFITKNVEDHGAIKYRLPKDLKNTEIFETFQKRKMILDRACSISRTVINSKEKDHKERYETQKTILDVSKKLPDSALCVPRLADKTQKQEHFYNDTFKFAVCLPTKTGCTNWQRGLVSLIKMGEKTPEELNDGEIFYDLDRFPKVNMMRQRSNRSSSNGYLTMVNVRHPLSRLLSAWRDKFRKGHPWMKIIEPKFGKFLQQLERKDMELELFEYSFEAFLELAAASEFDFMRDQHWRSMVFHCGPCNNEYDFIVHQEHGSEEQEFILKAMDVADKTHIPGKYQTALKGYDEILTNFVDVPEAVIKELYKIYYPDFVYFGYEIDDFLKVAKKDTVDDAFIKLRQTVRIEITKKFFPYREKFHENECDETFTADYNDDHPQ